MPVIYSQNTEQSTTPMNVDVVDETLEESERPIEIVEDVKFTEQRRRVSSALESINFRHDLEAVLESKTDARPVYSSFTVPITDMNACGTYTASQIPINDIRNKDAFRQQEKELRCKLASLCRLINLHGWASGIYNHVSARIDPKQEHFLVNPFGVLYYELTASSLIKIDCEGNHVSQNNSSGFSFNRAIFSLHSAIHRIRPDVKCVIHMHSTAACTVSSLKEGMLPLCHEALLLGGISYHEYSGLCGEELAKSLLCNDLGPFNKVLILRNHGLAICADSVEEAWSLVCNTMKACEVQCEAMAAVGGRLESLIIPSEAIQKQMVEASRVTCVSAGEKQLKTGELEFEAAMRILDNSGMRTGYVYKFPYDLKSTSAEQYECTIPAVQSSLSFADNPRSCRTWSGKNNYLQKAEWLISHNSYVKQHSAGDVPFSCTKWSPNTSFSSSTPIKINKHTFVPLGTNKAELKVRQEQMKENRLTGIISAGPITEICKNIDHYDTNISDTAAERKIIVGAASRAIVKREEQQNPNVYKSNYVQNPFSMPDYDADEDEMEQTKRPQLTKDHRVFANLHFESIADSSAQRVSSPEHKSERKKSSFRTPSFLKRKKREMSSAEKNVC